MVAVIAPTIVRVSHHHLYGGRNIVNVVDINVEALTGSSRADAVTELITHVAAPWQDNMIPNSSTGLTYQGGSWVDLDSATGGSGTFGPAAGHPTVGTRSDAFLPPNTSFLIHLHSTTTRGTRQGRLFIGPCREAQVDGGGNLLAGVASGLAGQVEAVRTAYDSISGGSHIESTAWRTVHVHKPSKTDPLTWTWSSSTIDSVSCDAKVATQRRRLR